MIIDVSKLPERVLDELVDLCNELNELTGRTIGTLRAGQLEVAVDYAAVFKRLIAERTT